MIQPNMREEFLSFNFDCNGFQSRERSNKKLYLLYNCIDERELLVYLGSSTLLRVRCPSRGFGY